MVGIRQSHRYDDMSEAQVQRVRERFLQPELLELYLAALLYFLFPLAAFLVFFLKGKAVTAVFELYLRSERPALTEVVSQIDNGMRQVELAV